MTTTDDLRRVLRAQAEQTHQWPAPRVPLRATPRRESRGLLIVAAAVAVVVAVALLPHLARAGAPTGTAARLPASEQTQVPDTGPEVWGTATLDWRATDCPSGAACVILPGALTSSGEQLVRAGTGGSTPTHHGTARSASLSLSMSGAPRTRWYLVGAPASGAASRLVVTAGTVTFRLRPGRLTLVRLHGLGHGEELVLTETARPLPRETLLVQEYTPAP